MEKGDRIRHIETGHRGTIFNAWDTGLTNVLMDCNNRHYNISTGSIELLTGIDAVKVGDTIISNNHAWEIIQIDREVVLLTNHRKEIYPYSFEGLKEMKFTIKPVLKEPEPLPELTKDDWTGYWDKECEFWNDGGIKPYNKYTLIGYDSTNTNYRFQTCHPTRGYISFNHCRPIREEE